jgi:hypothetical protein
MSIWESFLVYQLSLRLISTVKEEENSMIKNGTSNNKYVSFTYVLKTKFITSLFNNINVYIFYTATNTVEKRLAFQQQWCIDKCSGNGTYELKCPDIGKRCVGQMERSFTNRFKEHLQSYKQQHQNSKFSQHLKECHHSFGPIHNITEIMQFVRKGNFVNVLE